MPLEDFSTRIFLAPRSNESSYDNFKSTIEHGIDYNRIEPFLEQEGKDILSKENKVYAWGNREVLKSRWDRMQPGDVVLFYSKGNFVMAGNLLYKQFSPEISDALWPRLEKYGNQPWSCLFFVHNLRPVLIPLSDINRLANYKENNILQGFQPLNEEGLMNVLEKYGSVDNFVNLYITGVTADGLAKLNEIASKGAEETTPNDLESVDKIVKDQDIQDVITQLQAMSTKTTTQRITAKVEKLKRDYLIVRKLKDVYHDECQICGFTIEKDNGERYSEVAHIQALGDGGPDHVKNMLVLCPNHHKMLDYGRLSINLAEMTATIGTETTKINNKHL
ncbi:MAG: HNH endonuclease [Candidatus Magasanikbacteria bacterium]